MTWTYNFRPDTITGATEVWSNDNGLELRHYRGIITCWENGQCKGGISGSEKDFFQKQGIQFRGCLVERYLLR